MKIGRLNRASFAKTARRAMFLFAFAVLGTQAAAGTVSVSYELNGKTVSFSGETLREVNDQMRTYWEVNGDGCAYNAEKLPADGTGTLTWTVSGTVEQGDYLNGGRWSFPRFRAGTSTGMEPISGRRSRSRRMRPARRSSPIRSLTCGIPIFRREPTRRPSRA